MNLGRVVRWRAIVVRPDLIIGREVMVERWGSIGAGLVELTLLLSSAVPLRRRPGVVCRKLAELNHAMTANDWQEPVSIRESGDVRKQAQFMLALYESEV